MTSTSDYKDLQSRSSPAMIAGIILSITLIAINLIFLDHSFIFRVMISLIHITAILIALFIMSRWYQKHMNTADETIHKLLSHLLELTASIETKKRHRKFERDSNGNIMRALSKLDDTKHNFEVFVKENNLKIEDLKKHMAQSYHQVEEVITSANQLSDLNQKYYQGTFSQVIALDEISKNMTGFATHIQAIAGNTTQANQFAQEMSLATEKGSSRMKEMMDAITTISESSQKVSEIIKTIDDIASKTNLLSLNATIEANRAGIHGQTFAVVAQEVRDLAIQSRDAVKQTTELVNATMNDLEMGTQISQNAMEALNVIREEVDKVSSFVEEIEGSANEQAASISLLNENLTNITQLTKAQENHAKQTASVSSELAGFSGKIRSILKNAESKYSDGKTGFLTEMGSLKINQIDREFRFVFDPFPPMTYSEGGKAKGFFIDIITEIFEKRLNIPVQFSEHDWDVCQSNVFEGKSDAVITVATDERMEFTEAQVRMIYPFRWVLFTYQDHPKLDLIQTMTSVEDIKNAGLSVITYPGDGWMKANVEAKGVKVTYNSNEFSEIVNKKSDLIIEEPLIAAQKMKLAGIRKEKLIRTQAVLQTTPFQLLVSKRSPFTTLIPQFDRKIAEVREDGTFNRMIEQYL